MSGIPFRMTSKCREKFVRYRKRERVLWWLIKDAPFLQPLIYESEHQSHDVVSHQIPFVDGLRLWTCVRGTNLISADSFKRGSAGFLWQPQIKVVEDLLNYSGRFGLRLFPFPVYPYSYHILNDLVIDTFSELLCLQT